MTETSRSDSELYSLDKLMQETRQLAARYRRTTGSTLPVTGEIARYDAARLLGLQLIEDPGSAIDAIGRGELKNRRILIKGRAIFDTARSSPRIGQLNPQQDWDLVVLVLFDEHYEAEEIYQASREQITEALAGKGTKKRGAMSIAQFRIIGHRVWDREHGLEQEIWDNRAD